jgi:hypothetical protein
MFPLGRSSSIVLAGGLAASLCGIAGMTAVMGQDDKGASNEPTPAVVKEVKADAITAKGLKTADELNAMLVARVELARKGYQSAFAGLTQTAKTGNRLILFRDPREAFDWSLRWLDAERDLAREPAELAAALEEHLKRVTELKTKVKSLSGNLLPKWALLDAEWHRSNAELWLAQAKSE